ncbi:MAG: ATP-binding protein [Comamonadaceae bacterium]|nr:ATP-binding protein [Comamonadaceae bacterium]
MRSLFARTAATFLLLMLLFQVLLFSVSGYFVVWPLLRNAAGDLAALMVLSAQTWVELPRERLGSYGEELRASHALDVQPARGPLGGKRSVLPYVRLLEAALSARVGQTVAVWVEEGENPRYVADIPAAGEVLRFSFTRDRIGTYPRGAMSLVVLGSLLLGVVAALIVARGLTRPLSRLAEATTRVGRAGDFQPLSEDGPQELALVAREFNRMAAQVRELLENRTTLLAGVSHDLRSPIARLRLALELLRGRPDAALAARMEQDLETMNALIGSFLEFSRGVEAEQPVPTDARQLLEDLADGARAQGAAVSVAGPQVCPVTVAPLALHRVVINLLENAVRYGGGAPVELMLRQDPGGTVIEVSDRGPGIPEADRDRVFQPFVRLENSRNTGTGGAGLGLAIARQIAQARGWRLSLEDRAGGGTLARLVLPDRAGDGSGSGNIGAERQGT